MQNIMWHNGRGRGRVKAREIGGKKEEYNVAICVLFGATRMF